MIRSDMFAQRVAHGYWIVVGENEPCVCVHRGLLRRREPQSAMRCADRPLAAVTSLSKPLRTLVEEYSSSKKKKSMSCSSRENDALLEESGVNNNNQRSLSTLLCWEIDLRARVDPWTIGWEIKRVSLTPHHSLLACLPPSSLLSSVQVGGRCRCLLYHNWTPDDSNPYRYEHSLGRVRVHDCYRKRESLSRRRTEVGLARIQIQDGRLERLAGKAHAFLVSVFHVEHWPISWLALTSQLSPANQRSPFRKAGIWLVQSVL